MGLVNCIDVRIYNYIRKIICSETRKTNSSSMDMDIDLTNLSDLLAIEKIAKKQITKEEQNESELRSVKSFVKILVSYLCKPTLITLFYYLWTTSFRSNNSKVITFTLHYILPR